MFVNRQSAMALMVIAGLTLPLGPSSRAATETTTPPSGATSPAAPGTADEQARDLFRARRYPEALAVYQRLRAETRHPTYLRNIGRCHQMMHQPAPAIDAFEAYLREASDLDAGERKEVQDYIAEMRRLEITSAPVTATPGAATAGTPTNAAVAASPAPAPAGAAMPAAPLVVATPAANDGEPPPSPSIARRWWFWAGLGALVVATGIVIGVSASGEDRLPCPGGAVCP